jgi:replicative DNA helicase
MSLQQLPHNLEAEQMVLGALFSFPDVWPQVASVLTAADFYPERHRIVFEIISELHRSGRPIDFTSATALIRERNQLESIGGAGYLMEIADMCITGETTKYYAGLVKDTALQREMYRALTDISKRVCSPGADLTEALSEGYRILADTANQRHKSNGAVRTLAEMAEIYTQHVSQLDKNRFITGFEPLDAIIKGVAPGEVMTIVAYSGLGKSAFLHNLLLDGCQRSNQHHIFYSLEMPLTRVFERTVQISLQRLTYNIESEFHHHNHENRADTMVSLASVNANKLLVCDEGGISLDKIELYTEQARAKYGKIGAIGIDYLGLCSAPGTRSEYERVSAVAEGAKHLAKRLNIPVIVLCQISREAAKDGNVQMSSAKGSGAVEASADYMISLQRTKNAEIMLKLLKNRNGEADIAFICDIKWPFLKFNSIRPFDEKAEKNVNRGIERGKKKGYIKEVEETDPF